MNWISINNLTPKEGMQILVIWISEEDGAVGTSQCTILNGEYWIRPGVFLQSNEIVKYWFEIPKMPQDIEDFYNQYNPSYCEDMLDNPEDYGLI